MFDSIFSPSIMIELFKSQCISYTLFAVQHENNEHMLLILPLVCLQRWLMWPTTRDGPKGNNFAIPYLVN